MRRITIKNLKNIVELKFDLPGNGVHLLSGVNGSGKTSLLACLRRIGHSHAFSHHFSASQQSDVLDNFDGAEIVYELDADSVTYAYGGERWVPRPRRLNSLLDSYGYPAVLYIGATADRITPRPEDFSPRRISQAPQNLREAANRIFETNKFDNLKRINLTRGVGNSAFLLQATPPPGATYFSEKNFSLGELCILKLVRTLTQCDRGSLVLIDELELALHPRAQIELLHYLEAIAREKGLTVIVSTHSVSLLKRVDRRRIIFLENNDGIVSVQYGCYPTYALGNLALDEERSPDVVIYVEDDAAQYISEALVRLCISDRFQNQPGLFPTVHVVPIGPYQSVVRFLARGRAMLPGTTRCFALLDHDVEEEALADWRENQRHAALAEFQALEERIAYLPWTPEVAICLFLRDHRQNAERRVRQFFGDQRLSWRQQELAQIPLGAGRPQRDASKAALRRISESLAETLPNHNESQVFKGLSEIFASWYFEGNRAASMQLFARLIA